MGALLSLAVVVITLSYALRQMQVLVDYGDTAH